MNTQTLFQCVPNFSEGQRLSVVTEIAAAIEAIPGARLIDYSADPDHNRSVMTFLGSAAPVRAAALAAARVAVARIDLRQHRGVHPRAGAIDVLPVVPLRNATREQAVSLAHEIGADLARELGLPVYFYEWAAFPFRISALPAIRRGGFEGLAKRSLVGAHAPDLGPEHLHPSAGIAIVGARGPLVAYNIWLNSSDIRIAQGIAEELRRDRDRLPELEGVRALGLYLASHDRVQVSMNLTQPDRTPLPGVYRYVAEAAGRWNVEVVESEIIGAIPEAALGGQTPEDLRWRAFKPTQILETWLGGE